MRTVNHHTIAGTLCFFFLAGYASAQKEQTNPALPECSPLAGQILRCPKLGFSYKVPFGWVDRTQDMQTEQTDPSQGDIHGGRSAPGGRTLLAVFERPPGTPGGVDPAVVIAVEYRSSYLTIKTAAEYFGPLAEIAEQRGFKMDGDPYSFSVGTKQLVRGDFVSGEGKDSVRQTSLVLLEKAYILSFTFLSDSDDEISSLMDNLTFAAVNKRAAQK
jgi:hypothetical protein